MEILIPYPHMRKDRSSGDIARIDRLLVRSSVFPLVRSSTRPLTLSSSCLIDNLAHSFPGFGLLVFAYPVILAHRLPAPL